MAAGRALAVLFDMNGVLIDDEHLHQRTVTAVLASYGFVVDDAVYAKYFAGRPDVDGLSRFLADHGRFEPALVRTLVAAKLAAYLEVADEVIPYDGAADLVRAVAAAGVAVGVVTGATRTEVALAMRRLEIERALDVIVSAEDVPEGKPSPRPYLKAAAALGVSPASCVVVEDSPAGVASAVAAGCRCVAVASTHPLEELREAHVRVARLRDLDTARLVETAVPRAGLAAPPARRAP
jgi:beta-phosphoglucomutase